MQPIKEETPQLTAEEVVKALKDGKSVEIRNAVIEGPLILESMVIEGKVTIEHTTFKGPVDCSYATFKQVLRLNGSTFEGNANFQAATAEKDVFLDKATFQGVANFLDLTVTGVSYCQFTTFKKGAIFNRAIFKKSIFFVPAFFLGGNADFMGARVGGNAWFTGSVFMQEALFGGVQIEGDFSLAAIFEGEADFTRARIVGNATFNITIFKKKVSFNSAQITGNAFFNPATFEGEADFGSVRIGGGAVFIQAVFKQKANAIFDSAQIKEHAFFALAIFEGEALFAGAQFGGGAKFERAQFKKKTSFYAAQFKMDTHFEGTVFSEDVNFVNTSFRTCFFESSSETESEEPAKITLTKFLGKIDLRGCTYERIYPTDIWKELMERLEPYDRQPFTQLEETFRKAGEDRLANDVYQKRRKLEGARIKIWKQPHTWMLDRFLWLFTAYGVQPWRILALSIVFLIIGMFIFQLDRAVELKQDIQQPTSVERPSHANPDEGVPHGWCEGFWLSVKFFLPVEIPFGEEWKASSKTFWRIKFSTIAILLKLAGWVLVPVGVAGLTGILKR